MTYCIEVGRAGIGEESVVLHHGFEQKPTREEVLNVILDEDMGYDDDYCEFDYYRID